MFAISITHTIYIFRENTFYPIFIFILSYTEVLSGSNSLLLYLMYWIAMFPMQ